MAKERQFRTRYTIDGKGNIRKYVDIEAWTFLRKPDERQVRVKDLPKGFLVHESFNYYDV